MTSIMAELWAPEDGLSLARQLNLQNINIELYVDVLVHLLTNLTSDNLMLEPLLNDCKTLIRSFPNYLVTHIFREVNRCTDRLAKMGAVQITDFLILYEPPPVVDNLPVFNKAKIFCNRLIVV